MGPSEGWFLAASLYSDIAILIILTSSICFMFVKLRLTVDVTGVVTLAFFWFSALTKTISSIQLQEQGLNGMTIATSILSQQLVWCSLYYFTFEMRIIQSVLESQDSSNLIKQQKKCKSQMYILITITMIYGAIYSIQRILETENPAAYSDYEFLRWCVGISRGAKIIGDLYLHIVFIRVFRYLLQYRSQVQRQRKQMTEENPKILSKFVILWVLFLFVVNLWSACNPIMIGIFLYELGNEYTQSKEYEFVLVLSRLVFPIKDFFIAMSLIWLYLQQGLNQKNQKIQARGYGISLVKEEASQFDSLLGSKYSQRTQDQEDSKMMGISVQNDQQIVKKQTINASVLDVTTSELDFDHQKEKLDKNEDDENMKVDQITAYPLVGRGTFNNQQFSNFIFEFAMYNLGKKVVVRSQPLSSTN